MKKIGATIKQHILTGISYVFPLLVVVAVSQRLTALAQPSGAVSQRYLNVFQTIVGLNLTIGELSLSLVFPILTGFIAFSIVDKLGLVPGLVGGLLVNQSKTGFLGAILMGLLVGYLCLGLKERVTLPQAINSMMPVFIIPVIGTALAVLLYQLVVVPPLSYLTAWLGVQLVQLPLVGNVVLAFCIGGMIGYDVGGPINKLAMIISFGLLTSHHYIANTAAQIAIIIPPLGAAVATFLAKGKYSTDLQAAGKRAWWMGLTGISEGTIPFRLEKPERLTWLNILGGALGASVAVAFGAVNQLPLSGFYAWPFVDGFGAYLLGLVAGTLFIALFSVKGRQKAEPELEEEMFDEDEWDSAD